jgi:hypothetical protein
MGTDIVRWFFIVDISAFAVSAGVFTGADIAFGSAATFRAHILKPGSTVFTFDLTVKLQRQAWILRTR